MIISLISEIVNSFMEYSLLSDNTCNKGEILLDTIGKRIRYARKIKNLSLTEVKELTGLSTGNLSELENDKFAPSANALISLRNVYNVSVDWILTGQNPMLISKKDSFEETAEPYSSKAEMQDTNLSKEEAELIDAYRKLEQERKRDIQGYINVVIPDRINSAIYTQKALKKRK